MTRNQNASSQQFLRVTRKQRQNEWMPSSIVEVPQHSKEGSQVEASNGINLKNVWRTSLFETLRIDKIIDHIKEGEEKTLGRMNTKGPINPTKSKHLDHTQRSNEVLP
ncbi:hypothetical protein J1N35_000264 [Gossypium stocksii]|uniref:Uncharacterized protein n=1 Tax=Gossypium stocksii TaxID=47602 RepID=A0A9D3WI11_9ROSI|nr:hypothetical protein J1N35_000264 [Gossypium stocksii]